METYVGGSAVAATIPLTDPAGNPLAVTSAQYRVVDSNNVEVVPLTSVSGFTAGDQEVLVTVSSTINALTALSSGQFSLVNRPTREARTIELYLVMDDTNTTFLTYTYLLEPTDALLTGINSFQTFVQAMITAAEIPNIPGFTKATDAEKLAALIDAREHILTLNFSLLNSNIGFGQDSLNYIPEGQYLSGYSANGLFMFQGNLGLLTADQFGRLPDRFQYALRKAQIAEADYILGGDPLSSRRRYGLILETIGEVKQMYRSSKPLELVLCRRALGYLSYWISMNKHIGRA